MANGYAAIVFSSSAPFAPLREPFYQSRLFVLVASPIVTERDEGLVREELPGRARRSRARADGSRRHTARSAGPPE